MSVSIFLNKLSVAQQSDDVDAYKQPRNKEPGSYRGFKEGRREAS